MQYVLWLAPLAVFTIASLPKKYVMPATYIYGAWQAIELLFRITYFQNWVTNLSVSRGTHVTSPVSDDLYGGIALIRYFTLIAFSFYLAGMTLKTKVSKD